MEPFKLFVRDKSSPGRESFEVAVEVAEFHGYQPGDRLITPTCVTREELDEEIDRLVRSLKAVQRQGSTKLRKNRS